MSTTFVNRYTNPYAVLLIGWALAFVVVLCSTLVNIWQNDVLWSVIGIVVLVIVGFAIREFFVKARSGVMQPKYHTPYKNSGFFDVVWFGFFLVFNVALFVGEFFTNAGGLFVRGCLILTFAILTAGYHADWHERTKHLR